MSNQTPTSIRVAGTDAAVLAESDLLQLSCGSDGCSANCCTKSAPIVLNPYEIALMCRESGMSYEDLLDLVETDRAKGFPLVMLPRDPSCHFWTAKGCRIYQARPLACRLYPLGRVFDNGQSHIVQPELNICSGLAPSPARTVGDYLASQDVDIQIQMADSWIEFVSAMELLPLPDKPVTSVAFHMLVYSPDTPPAVGHPELSSSLEDRFILRLATAREQLPRFLCSVKAS
jgi:Fe-S-cluster containining protein